MTEYCEAKTFPSFFPSLQPWKWCFKHLLWVRGREEAGGGGEGRELCLQNYKPHFIATRGLCLQKRVFIALYTPYIRDDSWNNEAPRAGGTNQLVKLTKPETCGNRLHLCRTILTPSSPNLRWEIKSFKQGTSGGELHLLSPLLPGRCQVSCRQKDLLSFCPKMGKISASPTPQKVSINQMDFASQSMTHTHTQTPVETKSGSKKNQRQNFYCEKKGGWNGSGCFDNAPIIIIIQNSNNIKESGEKFGEN